MAIKVGKDGAFIVIESDEQNLINVSNFNFSFNGANTVLIDEGEDRTFQEETALLEDSLGSVIGTQAQVDTYLKSLTTSSGGGGTSDTTAANQVIANNSLSEIDDQTAAKKIGYVLDLSATPPPYTDLIQLEFVINFESTVYSIANMAAQNADELASTLNRVQDELYFSFLSTNELYFIPISLSVLEINAIAITDSVEGILSFVEPFLGTADQPTGAIHQAVTFLKKLYVSANKVAIASKSRLQILDTESETFSDYTQLQIICHAPDGSFEFAYGDDTPMSLPYTDPIDTELRITGVNDDFNGAKASKKLTVTNVSGSDYFISIAKTV